MHEENEKIVKEFLRDLSARGCSKNTIRGYELDLTKFFEAMDKNYLDITFREIKLYFNEMAGIKSPRTVGRKMASVRSFYRWVEEIKAEEGEKYVPPTKALKSPKMPKRVPKYFTHDEVMRIINAAKCTRDKAVMMLLYSSGMRIDEMYKLNRTDIDWETKSMKVIGKGNKERVSQFNEETKELLLEYLATRNDDNPALFVGKGGGRLSKRTVQKFVSQAGKDAGMKRPVTPHKFRHSLASRLVQNSVPIQVVQSILGHNDISTTQIYACLDNKTVRDAYASVFDKDR